MIKKGGPCRQPWTSCKHGYACSVRSVPQDSDDSDLGQRPKQSSQQISNTALPMQRHIHSGMTQQTPTTARRIHSHVFEPSLLPLSVASAPCLSASLVSAVVSPLCETAPACARAACPCARPWCTLTSALFL